MAEVPSSFEELYKTYYHIAVQICRSKGVSEPEDAAQHIFARLHERDIIAEYNPEYQSTFHVGRRVTFKSFIQKVIANYALGLAQRDLKRRRRNQLLMDQPVEDGSDLAQFLTACDGGMAEPEEKEQYKFLICTLRDHMANVPNRGRCCMLEILQLALEQFEEEGRVTRAELARGMSISSTAAGYMYQSFQQEVRECVRIIGQSSD